MKYDRDDSCLRSSFGHRHFESKDLNRLLAYWCWSVQTLRTPLWGYVRNRIVCFLVLWTVRPFRCYLKKYYTGLYIICKLKPENKNKKRTVKFRTRLLRFKEKFYDDHILNRYFSYLIYPWGAAFGVPIMHWYPQAYLGRCSFSTMSFAGYVSIQTHAWAWGHAKCC